MFTVYLLDIYCIFELNLQCISGIFTVYFRCISGVEVPSKDSMPKKKPVYGDKRKKKPNAPTPEGSSQQQLGFIH